jgi:molecular chaperone DnaJ
MLPQVFAVLCLLTVPVAFAQQPGFLDGKRGSEEISEYYNVRDVRIAMAVIAAAIIGVFLYLARDTILRRKTEYDKSSYASKQNRDYEKYHSGWGGEDEDFFGKTKSDEFRKMHQESRLPNYYEILGIPPDSTQDEIKSRFRQLVKEHHPDRTRDDKTSETLAEINKAYEVLSDEEKRSSYDKYFKATS